MRKFFLGALLLALALPAAAHPTYGVSLYWPIGERASSPSIALSIDGFALALRDRKSADEEKTSLTCPPQGCSSGFLFMVGTVYVLGTWALIRVLDKD